MGSREMCEIFLTRPRRKCKLESALPRSSEGFRRWILLSLCLNFCLSACGGIKAPLSLRAVCPSLGLVGEVDALGTNNNNNNKYNILDGKFHQNETESTFRPFCGRCRHSLGAGRQGPLGRRSNLKQ